MKSLSQKGFSVYTVFGRYVWTRACSLFFLVWSWELGLSVMSKADLPSYTLTLPSLTPCWSMSTTSFLPLLYLQTLPLCWFHHFRLEICLTSSILKKNPPSLPPSPVLSLSFLSWKSYLNIFYSHFTSSPPICYCTHDSRLSCYSSLKRLSCYEDFPHFSYFLHLSY